ncbi:MAG: ribbon-helix-helix protein, CopG family [Candidatus Eremiobacteraeota bacterium]|nr:ribbon-helix-helix protein, CopG family [Candidatus Eremiobacteraeota bacterium]MCW5870997.1 ribbon-helix-helix protein, CopG family [Candidatus Eremiobacteraeota bacterium]
MPSTTIHIPPPLLAALDAKARARGVSRNRLIVQTLEKSLHETQDWDQDFLARLRRPVGAAMARELDKMMESIASTRTRKPAVEL